MRRHEAERAFIERELTTATETGTTAVVITHHAPTSRSVAPRFEGDPCNAAFASDLEGVIAQYQPPLWIHGHMHNPVDVALGETRVLCNPAGYNALANARHGYDPEFCIEIDAVNTLAAARAAGQLKRALARYRELDERPELTAMADDLLLDTRLTPLSTTQHDSGKPEWENLP